MKITSYGHACFGIEINGINIVVDPFITANPLASNIDLDSVKAHYILVTHAHQDHILDVEALARKTGALLISNYEIVMYYNEKGLKGHPINHGGTFKAENFSAKYVNAIHTSSFPDGTYGGQPGGFVITAGDKSLYIAGDTALTMDMKLIPMTTKLTASILPIGDNFTMGVDDAIIASDFVECDKVIGCHYNTFPPIEIETEEAKEKFSNKQKELILLEIGNSINL
ncbi:L-ascorbate metabolism protein UlaG, beta-lactamase superfamily [Tenacibaculum sp. MAR_2009_124]|uniref:metal-dependent hydrolase n=1 Tax=Tenacibaculum sp. MAR_2009_124 TaxID=1250059 RepID=UPI000894BBC9|nr:metal-dependent hydrolase [Tenacibaculum sp. MAR_2009_124]SEC92010.1 L-ascorbate metabolism protein UlaG, beta-lactamase superfamily [Tenacibaculum sp. MAR_2009_124]